MEDTEDSQSKAVFDAMCTKWQENMKQELGKHEKLRVWKSVKWKNIHKVQELERYKWKSKWKQVNDTTVARDMSATGDALLEAFKKDGLMAESFVYKKSEKECGNLFAEPHWSTNVAPSAEGKSVGEDPLVDYVESDTRDMKSWKGVADITRESFSLEYGITSVDPIVG